MSTDNTNRQKNILIQSINDTSLVLNINGEIREIRNQLEELKSILGEQKVQTIQYAEKIYNIEHINEANFGIVTGKKAFNEYLTKEVLESIQIHKPRVQEFLKRASSAPNWQQQERIRKTAQDIICSHFVGVVGFQLDILRVIGKEELSEQKQRRYIAQCIHVGKTILDLVSFALLSNLWNVCRDSPVKSTNSQKEGIKKKLYNFYGPSIEDQFDFLQSLYHMYSENKIAFPISELETFDTHLQDESALFKSCKQLHQLNNALDSNKYNLLDCFSAEKELTTLLKSFSFLVNYQMASIKQIGYRQPRNTEPRYIHHYDILSGKSDMTAERINYTKDTVPTNSVIIYKGNNYQNNINLFPFIIDYNALNLERKTKICFFSHNELDDDDIFIYQVLKDQSQVDIKFKGIITENTDYSEIMSNLETVKALNMDSAITSLKQARNKILGYS